MFFHRPYPVLSKFCIMFFWGIFNFFVYFFLSGILFKSLYLKDNYKKLSLVTSFSDNYNFNFKKFFK